MGRAGWSSTMIRSKLFFTAAESNVAPSWKTTPSRSLKVHTLWSSWEYSVARHGSHVTG